MSGPPPWPALDPWPPGWLGDTPPRTVAHWRAMTMAERYAAVMRARATARVWVLAGERLRQPDEDEDSLRARVRQRLARAAG